MRIFLIRVLLILIACAAPLFGQGSVSGTITGVVADTTGGVIAGATVTVTGPALLKAREQKSVGGGTYLIDQLPPGTYQVTAVLPNFKKFVEEGVVLTAGFTATVNISLALGEATDTVTVTGSGPVVDVQSSNTPTTFDSTLLQNTPSGRDPWSTLAQTPGVTTSTFDVAGNQSFQQSSMSVHGSKTTETVYAFNGLDLNGTSGTSTLFYVDYDSFQEMQVVTDAAPPEIPIGGAYMNMITRSGSNQVHGFAAFYYLDDKTQAPIKAPIFNGQAVTNAGSPFIRAYDGTAQAGGPIIRDRWWIFGAYREYQLKQTLLNSPVRLTDGTLTPYHGTDVNHQTNTTLRTDYLINQKNVFNAQWLWNYQNRFFRRNTTYSYVDQAAAYVQIEPAYILEAQETYSPTSHLSIDSRIGYAQVVFPERYQPNVAPSTIPAIDLGQSTLQFAGLENYVNKQKVGRVASTATYFHGGWKGSHNFKVGVDFGLGRNYVNYSYNQNIFELYNTLTGTVPNLVPWEVQVQNGTTESNSWSHSRAVFVQDAWTISRRLTLNIGARYDQSHAYLSPQCSPAIDTPQYASLFPNRCLSDFQQAGSSLGPLTNFNNVNSYQSVVPRISVAYDPTGKGDQVIRAGFNMFTLNAGTALADAINPNGPSVATYGWNGSTIAGSAVAGAANSATPDYTKFAPSCGSNSAGTGGCLPSGTFTGTAKAGIGGYLGTTGGITTYIDPNLKRPYSIQFNVGYQRTIFKDTSVGIAYYYRTTKDLYAPVNINGPTSDYTPVSITNPYTGTPLTVYSLTGNSKACPGHTTDVGCGYYEITNVGSLNNNRYDGLELTATRRMINHFQILAGLTIQREHGNYSGSATASASEDFNDPNRAINRYGSLDQDSPYVARVDVTYQAPYGVQFSVNYQHETGFAIVPTTNFSLAQGSVSVKLAPNGSLRYDSVNDTNLRISRPTHLSERFLLEPLVDLNNLFNVSPVTAETTTIGANFQKPTNFLGPFVARFGAKLSF